MIMTRLALLRLTLLAASVLPLAACETSPTGTNRGMESVHQPVVSHDNYAFDVQVGPDGGLNAQEARRLDNWLASIELGYGDRVALAGESYYGSAARDIGSIVARYGLLVEEDQTPDTVAASPSSIRVLVRRAVARVPGCPDWSTKQENNGAGGTHSNFGCGLNSNLAAMIANPEDLVRGQTANSDLRTATSNRAIQVYREKQPTGSGDLKDAKAGSN
jgi:pilus assembly protein CpaD